MDRQGFEAGATGVPGPPLRLMGPPPTALPSPWQPRQELRSSFKFCLRDSEPYYLITKSARQSLTDPPP